MKTDVKHPTIIQGGMGIRISLNKLAKACMNSGIVATISAAQTGFLKKNFKTDSTELYDLSYQYEIDCLSAGLVYRREFYHDSDIEEIISIKNI